MLEGRECRRAHRRTGGRRRRSRRNEDGGCGALCFGGLMIFALLWWMTSHRSGKSAVPDPCAGSKLSDCEEQLQSAQAAMEEQSAEVTNLSINLEDLANKNEHLIAKVSKSVQEVTKASALAKEFFYTGQLGLLIAIVTTMLFSSVPFCFLLFFMKRDRDAALCKLMENEVKAEEVLEMQRRFNEVTSRMNELISRMNETTGCLHGEQSKNKEMADEVDALKRALDVANQPSTRELHLLEIERRIKDKRSVRTEMVQKYLAQCRRSSKPQIENEQLKTENKLLANELAEARTHTSQLEAKLASDGADAMSEELRALRGKVRSLMIENGRLKASNRDLESERTNHRAEAARNLAECRERASSLTDVNATLKSRCEELEVENESLKGQVGVMRGVQSRLLEQNRKVLFFADQLKKRIQELEGGAGPSGSSGEQ